MSKATNKLSLYIGSEITLNNEYSSCAMPEKQNFLFLSF